MLILEVFSLFITLAAAIYRDNTKTMKPLPSFTNSLVNLGKMDFSFYFAAKPEDFKKFENVDHLSGSLSPRTERIVEETCPCESKFSRNLKNHPSELLRKILTSNDLFSFNKEPEVSNICCESHEKIREETIILDFSPNQSQAKENHMQQNLPLLPFIFDNFVTNKPTLPLRPKTVEIFFFPKNKEIISNFGKSKKKELEKQGIQIVGDKEMRNDFKTLDLTPPRAVQSSVKKDLGVQGTGEKSSTKATKEFHLGTTSAVPNMI